jgi:REP element-mobilizing transposase RayT
LTFEVVNSLKPLKVAKTEHYYTRFEDDGVYHIYNRTVDRKPMFTSKDNYMFFIRKFDKYLSDFIKIYAYCLLGNHFHFLIKINELTPVNASDMHVNPKQKTTHDIVSNQLRKFFQSYAMAFNKQQNRIGTLFQTPFKRVKIKDERYFKELTCYINTNAQKHNLVDDFRQWKWSSYRKLISSKKTKLLKDELIRNYFDDLDNFIYCHLEYSNNMTASKNEYFIED